MFASQRGSLSWNADEIGYKIRQIAREKGAAGLAAHIVAIGQLAEREGWEKREFSRDLEDAAAFELMETIAIFAANWPKDIGDALREAGLFPATVNPIK